MTYNMHGVIAIMPLTRPESFADHGRIWSSFRVAITNRLPRPSDYRAGKAGLSVSAEVRRGGSSRHATLTFNVCYRGFTDKDMVKPFKDAAGGLIEDCICTALHDQDEIAAGIAFLRSSRRILRDAVKS